MIWKDCLGPKYEPHYWFLNFLKHFSICNDFSKFPCLVVKTDFKFFYLSGPPQANFSFVDWHPASIYLRVRTIFDAFSSMLGTLRIFFMRSALIFLAPFGRFFFTRGA